MKLIVYIARSNVSIFSGTSSGTYGWSATLRLLAGMDAKHIEWLGETWKWCSTVRMEMLMESVRSDNWIVFDVFVTTLGLYFPLVAIYHHYIVIFIEMPFSSGSNLFCDIFLRQKTKQNKRKTEVYQIYNTIDEFTFLRYKLCSIFIISNFVITMYTLQSSRTWCVMNNLYSHLDHR